MARFPIRFSQGAPAVSGGARTTPSGVTPVDFSRAASDLTKIGVSEIKRREQEDYESLLYEAKPLLETAHERAEAEMDPLGTNREQVYNGKVESILSEMEKRHGSKAIQRLRDDIKPLKANHLSRLGREAVVRQERAKLEPLEQGTSSIAAVVYDNPEYYHEQDVAANIDETFTSVLGDTESSKAARKAAKTQIYEAYRDSRLEGKGFIVQENEDGSTQQVPLGTLMNQRLLLNEIQSGKFDYLDETQRAAEVRMVEREIAATEARLVREYENSVSEYKDAVREGAQPDFRPSPGEAADVLSDEQLQAHVDGMIAAEAEGVVGEAIARAPFGASNEVVAVASGAIDGLIGGTKEAQQSKKRILSKEDADKKAREADFSKHQYGVASPNDRSLADSGMAGVERLILGGYSSEEEEGVVAQAAALKGWDKYLRSRELAHGTDSANFYPNLIPREVAASMAKSMRVQAIESDDQGALLRMGVLARAVGPETWSRIMDDLEREDPGLAVLRPLAAYGPIEASELAITGVRRSQQNQQVIKDRDGNDKSIKAVRSLVEAGMSETWRAKLSDPPTYEGGVDPADAMQELLTVTTLELVARRNMSPEDAYAVAEKKLLRDHFTPVSKYLMVPKDAGVSEDKVGMLSTVVSGDVGVLLRAKAMQGSIEFFPGGSAVVGIGAAGGIPDIEVSGDEFDLSELIFDVDGGTYLDGTLLQGRPTDKQPSEFHRAALRELAPGKMTIGPGEDGLFSVGYENKSGTFSPFVSRTGSPLELSPEDVSYIFEMSQRVDAIGGEDNPFAMDMVSVLDMNQVRDRFKEVLTSKLGDDAVARQAERDALRESLRSRREKRMQSLGPEPGKGKLLDPESRRAYQKAQKERMEKAFPGGVQSGREFFRSLIGLD